MLIQLVILLFIGFVLSRVTKRFRAEDITGREFSVWVIFWGLVALATLFPKGTDKIAEFVGVQRGADLLVYISVLVLFFMAFKILARLDRVERDITRVVRHVALDEKKKDE